jgi:hypothetical protein
MLLFDSDPTAGASDAITRAVAHSRKTKVGTQALKDLWGQSTDSGGGGTLHSLKDALELLGGVSL